MLLQDRFAFKAIYECLFLNGWLLQKDVNRIMEDCSMNYKKGNSYIDLLKAINKARSGAKSVSEWLERGAEEIDKVMVRV